MKNDAHKMITKISPLINQLEKYWSMILIVSYLGVYIYLVLHIGNLINQEPEQTNVQQASNSVQQLKIDEDSVNQLLSLEEQNIEVKALFEDARNNPFNE